ncbi:MAG: DUF2029 domain-containing protein [Hyphomonadaceae bacterium]|nr:DUF2029 domain-containing protein [Hyphomonadaceae bacterium]
MHNKNFIKWATIALGPACIFLLFVSSYSLRLEQGFILNDLNFLIGRDLVNTWQYGVAAFTENPALNYDPGVYNAKLDQIIPGIDYPYQQWSYPPHFMLLAAPFGFMGYNLVFVAFLLTSLALYWKFIMKPFESIDVRLALLLTPPLFFCLISGNLSAYIAVIFVVVFRTMDERPVLAGILIALLTVKPQVGFLFPVFLLASGRYRVFAAATIATLAFVGASILIHGLAPWETYINAGIGQQANLITNSEIGILGLMPTLTTNLGILGVPMETGTLIQIAVAIPLVVAMIWVCRKQQDPFLQYAVFLGVSFAATPYLMIYDTVVLAWLILSLLVMYPAKFMQKSIYLLLMLLPIIGVVLVQFGITGTYLIMFGLAIWTLQAAWPKPNLVQPP